jgi:hypothetical protein
MNNDSTPSPAADALPHASASESAGHERPLERAASPEQQQQQQAPQTPAQKRALLRLRKKCEFIDALMANLDVLINVELIILYYMEWVFLPVDLWSKKEIPCSSMHDVICSCSLFRLLLRVLAQMAFLTPKPNYMLPLPQYRPYITAIFGPNIICALLHLLTARSEAPETMRGYLHGGIIIDLIGYKGPTSKTHLLLLDILVLALQCFMLAVHVEKERVALVVALLSRGASTDQPRVEVASAQDHDAEERGVVRENVMDGDIEMQEMAPRSDGSLTETDQERARLLEEQPPRHETQNDDDPLDMFLTGLAVVADFHVLSTLRKQWNQYRNAPALPTVGFSAELAAVTRNRQLSAANRGFQRRVEALAG